MGVLDFDSWTRAPARLPPVLRFVETRGVDDAGRRILAQMEPAGRPPPDRLDRAPTLVEVWRRYDDDEHRLSAHVSECMLDLAGLRPGSRVLDIATGRGEPALRAAARVAPDGVVVGTDLSESMLEFARARAAAF